MKIKLVFYDWHKDGRSVYSTEGIAAALSSGDFHSGTTFDAEIVLTEDNEADLRSALAQGYRPVFWVAEGKP